MRNLLRRLFSLIRERKYIRRKNTGAAICLTPRWKNSAFFFGRSAEEPPPPVALFLPGADLYVEKLGSTIKSNLNLTSSKRFMLIALSTIRVWGFSRTPSSLICNRCYLNGFVFQQLALDIIQLNFTEPAGNACKCALITKWLATCLLYLATWKSRRLYLFFEPSDWLARHFMTRKVPEHRKLTRVLSLPTSSTDKHLNDPTQIGWLIRQGDNCCGNWHSSGKRNVALLVRGIDKIRV